MFKTLAPIALLTLLPFTGSAYAKQCPTGQMFRTSLGVCQAKSAVNAKFLKSVNHARRGPKQVAALPEPAPRPIDEADHADETVVAKTQPASEPAAAPATAPVAAEAANSPFGALPSAAGFR